jgi:hypothetical protein
VTIHDTVLVVPGPQGIPNTFPALTEVPVTGDRDGCERQAPILVKGVSGEEDFLYVANAWPRRHGIVGPDCHLQITGTLSMSCMCILLGPW